MSERTSRQRDQVGAQPRSVRRLHDEMRTADDKALLVALGRHIRTSRRSKGLTIAQLATVVDLDPAYLGELERGRANISVLTLGHKGRALGVTASWLLNPDD